jgi:hypothetical protein
MVYKNKFSKMYILLKSTYIVNVQTQTIMEQNKVSRNKSPHLWSIDFCLLWGFFVFCLVLDRVLLCSPGWPWTLYPPVSTLSAGIIDACHYIQFGSLIFSKAKNTQWGEEDCHSINDAGKTGPTYKEEWNETLISFHAQKSNTKSLKSLQLRFS